MTIATLIVAPDSMIELALAWSQRGLITDSLWVSSDNLGDIDRDRPNAIVAKWIRFGRETEDGQLALMLAGLESLLEARVVWVRTSADANDERLATLAHLLLELFPYETTHWIDVVVPQRRTDQTVAPLAGEWVQLRVDTSDRSAPNAVDAGWDLDLAVPLHVTAAVAGILGGSTTMLPWAKRNADQNHVVRVFSRLVDGGVVARREASRFVTEVLPVTNAAEQHPDTFLAANPAQSAKIIDDTTNWVLGLADGRLRYQPEPASRLRAQERVSLRRHLMQFVRFVPLGLQTLLGVRPEPDAVTGHILEFDDLGYSIGREIPVVKWTHGVPDFAALEQEAATAAVEMLSAVAARDGDRPPGGVWEPMCRVTTALIDGGRAVPDAWQAPVSQERRLTLPPDRVLLGPQQDVNSPVPELALAENAAVAVGALDEARRSHGDVMHAPLDSTLVTRSAVRLARQANENDAQALDEQLAALGSVALSARPASVLEKIHGAVLGGTIRSRLDAERWERAATSTPPGPAPDWWAVTRRFRWFLGTLTTVMMAIGFLWQRWHTEITSSLGVSVGVGTGTMVLAGVFVLLLIVGVYLLYRAWAALTELGRRRLELMGLWLRRAVAAAMAHAAQINTERAVRAWAQLLTRVPDRAEPRLGDPLDPDLEKMPMAMRIGHPQFSEARMRGWLAESGAEPGWRLAALQDVVGHLVGVPPERSLAKLAEDRGLSGGKLDVLTDGLDAYQSVWRSSAIQATSDGVKRRMMDDSDSLLVLRNPNLARQQASATKFLGEVGPVRDEDDWPDDPLHNWVISVGYSEDNPRPQLHLSEALCDARIRIQVRQWVPSGGQDLEQDFGADFLADQVQGFR